MENGSWLVACSLWKTLNAPSRMTCSIPATHYVQRTTYYVPYYLPHPTSYSQTNNPPPACGHLPRRGRQNNQVACGSQPVETPHYVVSRAHNRACPHPTSNLLLPTTYYVKFTYPPPTPHLPQPIHHLPCTTYCLPSVTSCLPFPKSGRMGLLSLPLAVRLMRIVVLFRLAVSAQVNEGTKEGIRCQGLRSTSISSSTWS